MASFIDMSWKVDEDRRQRALAASKAVSATSPPALDPHNTESRSAPAPACDAHPAPSTATAAQPPPTREPVQKGLTLRRRIHELLHPSARRKRVLDEHAAALGWGMCFARPVGAPVVGGRTASGGGDGDVWWADGDGDGEGVLDERELEERGVVERREERGR